MENSTSFLNRQKIVSIETLSDWVSEQKALGKTVAHAHGCFDLLHVGHIRHLSCARRFADFLVVSVTPDRFITKGPGRPIFDENSRMEQLAALEFVDYVCLSTTPDAYDLIKRIRPTCYVKGSEYRQLDGDITGKIRLEKEAVESVGGELVFTDEPTLSSTEILNRQVQFLPDEIQTYLSGLRGQCSPRMIRESIDSLKSIRALVIGDLIIDEYCYCHVSGTVSKYPTLAAIYDGMQRMVGGAGAVARHVAQFAGRTTLLSAIGTLGPDSQFAQKLLESNGVETIFYEWPDAFTVTKRRYITGGYPNTLAPAATPLTASVRLFEIGFMPKPPLPNSAERQIVQFLNGRISEFDLVIIADFGHSFVTSLISEQVREKARWWSVNAQTNSSNFGFNRITKYRRANFYCIDELEARLPFGDKVRPLDEIAAELRNTMEARELMITRGGAGLCFYEKEIHRVPALATRIVDTVGAGDAVLAISSLCRRAALDPKLSAYLSCCAGAVASGIQGNDEPVKKYDLIKYAEGPLK